MKDQLNTLILEDTAVIKDGKLIGAQVAEAHRIIAQGVANQSEQVDVVVLNGERLAKLIIQSQNFHYEALERSLREYGLDSIRVTQSFGLISADPEQSLRVRYGDLRFLNDVRPDLFVAYRLER